MEKRVFGIILTILGIAGLILGAVTFVNSTNNEQGEGDHYLWHTRVDLLL